MDDLISREAALKAVNAYDYRGFTVELVKTITDGCAIELKKLPAVDAEPVRHGKWVFDKNANNWGIGGYVCSECQAINDNLPYVKVAVPLMFVGTKYCPNCGAKMEGT